MKTKELENVFQVLCESKSKQLNAIMTNYTSSSKEAIFDMTLEKVKIELIYHKKKSIFIPISTLYCRIYLDRESDVYYHLPEIIGYLHNHDFRCCYFPYIENIYRMNNCFNALFDILDDYLVLFESWNRIDKDRIYESQKDFLLEAFEMNEDEFEGEFERKFYDRNYYPYRFTSFEGYIDFLNNDYLKAIPKYEKIIKKDTICAYEHQLIEYMRTHTSFPSISKECFSLKDVHPYIHSSKLELKELLKFTFVMAIPFITISCLILIVYKHFMSMNTIAFYGSHWAWGFLVGLLPAIFGGMACRKSIYKLFKMKNHIQWLDYEDLLSGNFTKIISRIAFVISLIYSIAMLLVCMSDMTRFYDSYFDVAGEELLSHINYQYEDIEDIYYMKARYNVYDERVERSSYVIHFKNDDYVDLDLVLSDEEMESKILPLLDKEVKHVDSDKELDWYHE